MRDKNSSALRRASTDLVQLKVLVLRTHRNTGQTYESTIPVELAPYESQHWVASFENESEWKWDAKYEGNLGRTDAQHDNDEIYELPFKRGGFEVTQSNNGPFSHNDLAFRYSIDWKMPVGTPVLAARAGQVVNIKMDSEVAGTTEEYRNQANYIAIEHSDGTIGRYCHLDRNSARVKLGQRVKAGEEIAKSGNTGFSGAPHLHFDVARTIRAEQLEGIKIRFRLSPTAVGIPQTGEFY